MNIDGVDYVRRSPPSQHHVWAWIIIVVLAILIIIFIYYHRYWSGIDNPDNDFGTYSDPVIGVCTGSNLCTDPGRQSVIRTCIPNPTSGKGCIVPFGENEGRQSYDSLIEVRDCTPHCVISRWQEITPEAPCVVENVSPSICVPSGTRGVRTTEFQCVSNDSTGTNQCTAYVFSEETNNYVLTTYQLGDISTIDSSCVDYANPICGEWNIVVPQPSEVAVPITTQSVGPCALSEQFSTGLNCRVDYSTIPGWNSNPLLNFLREGYDSNPLSCVYEEDGTTFAVTPTLPSIRCEQLTPPACVESITSDQIVNGQLPVDAAGEVEATFCGSTFEPNPSCYQTCRLLGNNMVTTEQFIDYTDSTIGPILDKWMSIRIPSVGYLTLKHIPCNLPDRKVLAPCDAAPEDKLFDVPTMFITYDMTGSNCTIPETEFNTALIFSVGLRSYDLGTVMGQILSLVGSNYIGWLSSNDGSEQVSTMIWKQALNQYLGNGISSVDPAASAYQVLATGPFDPTPPVGFPMGTLGTIGLSIRDNNGQTISVPVIDGSTVTLDNVEAVIYDSNTLNLSSRDNPYGCNLLLTS